MLLCAVCSPPARAQGDAPQQPHREVHFETGASIGNLHLFAYDDNRALHPVGVEYDRPWVRSVLKGNLQYVSEVLPIIILSAAPRVAEGSPALGSARKHQYGFGLAPAGFRLLWRETGLLQPYFGMKGGAAYFMNRVANGQGTRMQLLAEFSAGAEKALSNRWGFRAGFSDFHMAGIGSGRHQASDFLYFNGGVSYRF